MDASINKQNNSNVVGHSFNAASNILDIGLAREIHMLELQNIQAFIAHKEHEVSVYENARRLIECQASGDRCMVFLADNLFVMRTREQALEILDRQIEVFQTALKYLRQEMASLTEKVALMERLNITNDGLVEIREPENEDKEGNGKIKGKRIQHSPTKKSPPSPNKSLSKPCSKNDEMDRINDEIDQILKRGEENNEDNNKINEKSKEDNTKPTRPKGVSEKDYERFVKLCDSLELSEDEEEKSDEKGEEMDVKEGEEENNNAKQERRRVHFSDILEDDEQKPIGMKKERSILKNKNEHSPIDSTELQKIDQKEQRRIYSVSKEIVKDEIMEREPFLKTKKNTQKSKNLKNFNKKQKNQRPISRWKAQRDGLLHDDSEDDYADR
uniref:Uncharacterized protein n=1 Tax=Meloidogyne enterolobii TaxID=390850 RepID=A0A6V7TM02_MELEN|nr:unnamed protein product [Meloidogyne enterolobii]